MEGLVKFREAFAEYSENYVVIGGAACDITMTNTVVSTRHTRHRHDSHRREHDRGFRQSLLAVCAGGWLST